jgi:hypothetical protein
VSWKLPSPASRHFVAFGCSTGEQHCHRLGLAHAQTRPEGGTGEPNMPLLFWYLPYIILSGAYASTMDTRDGKGAPEAE